MSTVSEHQYTKVASLLIDLEMELRHLQLWQSQQPSAQALASTVPFCVDTLGFDQWLQFVFLPTLQQMIALGMTLPSHCQVTPMAEEFLRARSNDALPAERLLTVLAALDRLMS